MKTVIDVGCARYGGDYSIERLIEYYSPDVLYGFDPAWTPDMLTGDVGATRVVVSNEAAWTHTGTVRFIIDGLNGQVGTARHWPETACVDLAAFIDELPDGEITLKLDAEGAEYNLLEHLIRTKVDVRLSRVLVEWHRAAHAERRRKAIERSLTCPYEEWRW